MFPFNPSTEVPGYFQSSRFALTLDDMTSLVQIGYASVPN